MHTLDQVAIGERIREVRGTATQLEFAARVGVGRVSVARYETGERTPDAEFVVKVWVACGVDPLWLLLGENRGVVAREPAPAYGLEGLALTAEEQELLDNYRRGGNADRRLIQGVARHTAKNPAPEVFDPEVLRERNRRTADPVERPVVLRPRRKRGVGGA